MVHMPHSLVNDRRGASIISPQDLAQPVHPLHNTGCFFPRQKHRSLSQQKGLTEAKSFGTVGVSRRSDHGNLGS